MTELDHLVGEVTDWPGFRSLGGLHKGHLKKLEVFLHHRCLAEYFRPTGAMGAFANGTYAAFLILLLMSLLEIQTPNSQTQPIGHWALVLVALIWPRR